MVTVNKKTKALIPGEVPICALDSLLEMAAI